MVDGLSCESRGDRTSKEPRHRRREGVGDLFVDRDVSSGEGPQGREALKPGAHRVRDFDGSFVVFLRKLPSDPGSHEPHLFPDFPRVLLAEIRPALLVAAASQSWGRNAHTRQIFFRRVSAFGAEEVAQDIFDSQRLGHVVRNDRGAQRFAGMG